MVGAAGVEPIETTTVLEFGEEQVPLSKCTKYEPALFTMIDCVVAPVDHTLSVAEDEVKVTDPLGHSVMGPTGVIEGVGNAPPTVTVIVFELIGEHPPTFKVTK